MTVPRPGVLIGCAVLVTISAAVGGYSLGHHNAVQAEWHTVTVRSADVASDESSHRLLTVNVNGWAYGMEDQVEYWVDESGSVHVSEWPACLEPAHPGEGPDANTGEVTFRFAAAEVATGIIDWRPIVMVDCRG